MKVRSTKENSSGGYEWGHQLLLLLSDLITHSLIWDVQQCRNNTTLL